MLTTVTGNTSVAAQFWPFMPNWREAVTIGYTFKTDIVTSRAGYEQRRALRSDPRSSVQMMHTLPADKMRGLQRLLTTAQAESFLFPDPIRNVALSAPVSAEATVVALSSVPAWLTAGRNVVLQDQDRLEYATVLSVAGNSISLAHGLSWEWGAAANVRPAFIGRVSGPPSATIYTGSVIEIKAELAVEPGSEPASTTPAWVDVYGGREVFTPRPNWKTSPTTQFNWDTDIIDFDFGRIDVFNPTEFGFEIRSATYTICNADDAYAISDFFIRQRGQQLEFFAPTQTDDFVLRAGILAGDTSIRVVGTGIYTDYYADEKYRAISIFLEDGRRWYRAISSLSHISDSEGEDTLITVDQQFYDDLDTSQIRNACFLLVSRFAADELNVEWQTSAICNIKVNLKSLPYLAAEGSVPVYDGAAQCSFDIWGPDGTYEIANAVAAAIAAYAVATAGYASV